MSENAANISQKKKLLTELDKKHYLHPTSGIKEQQEQGAAIVVEKGNGIYLYDYEGTKYIDGLSSLWNVNVGHGREELGKAAWKQMNRLGFSSSFSSLSHEPAIKLATKIAAMTPGDLNVSFFTTGGSDANESAFKLIRHYWKLKGQPNRYKFISRKFAYHGVMMGATSATGIPAFHEMSSPLTSGFLHAAAPYCYNCEFGKEYPACELDCAQNIETIIKNEGEDTIAGVIAEPVQGAGGVIIPPDGYLQKTREICDKYGIFMIADEVITGFGRTGKMFGVEQSMVVPDVLVLAKGITSGYIPLGAVVITDRIREELINNSQPGILAHGLTCSGHPTSCAVALANLEIIEKENLVENCKNMGSILLEELKGIESESPIVGEARALGLLGAVELVKNKTTKEKFNLSQAVAKKVYLRCMQKGLIVRAINIYGSDVIAMAPPLIINEEQIKEMSRILKESIIETYKEIR
jgi:putrescine aminotransferase